MSDDDKNDVFDLGNLILLDGVGILVTCIRLNADCSMQVESRDIREILATRPEIAQVYNEISYFRFYDKIVGKSRYKGKDVDMESVVMLDPSPRYFMPNRGAIYTVEELKAMPHEWSKKLVIMLENQGWTACFVDGVSSLITQANPEKGDRILDKSELVFPKVEEPTLPETIPPEKAN